MSVSSLAYVLHGFQQNVLISRISGKERQNIDLK